MTQPFGPDYANYYDTLYTEKDYEAECDLIERLLRTYGQAKMSSILDLGCGTGNHALPLARRGLTVVGVDRSEFMLKQARSKAASTAPTCHVDFYNADIRHVDLGRRFDAVLMMFAVLGYQLANVDVMAAFHVARHHLNPGGLLLLDVWHGPAVLLQRPSERLRVIPIANGKILRTASSELDTNRNICTVRYHLWTFTERLVSEAEEEHTVRYFFPLELDFFLESADFASVRSGAFPQFDRILDENTWNALWLARAV